MALSNVLKKLARKAVAARRNRDPKKARKEHDAFVASLPELPAIPQEGDETVAMVISKRNDQKQ
jgi:hypothetical protein